MSPEVWDIILDAVIGVLVILVGASGFFAYTILSMRKLRVERIDASDASIARHTEAASRYHAWAEAHGMSHCGYYRAVPGSAVLSIWSSQADQRFLTITWIAGQNTVEFMTQYSDRVALDTAVSANSQFLPKPVGLYCQSCDGLDLDGLWEWHLAGASYLSRYGRFLRMPLAVGTVEQAIVDETVRRCDYVCSHVLWPLRALIWYLWRRRRFHGHSLESQHQRGWITLPGEGAEVY